MESTDQINQVLVDWLRSRPPWQQDLARRLAASDALDEGDREPVAKMILVAHGARIDAPEPQPIMLADLPEAPTSGGSPRLVSLGHLKGVGAVAADQELRFGRDGITVVYGNNAAGKSSYARVLKRACRAVDRDSKVVANVYEEQRSNRPTAKLEIDRGGLLEAQQLDLTAPGPPTLASISVFDARCAQLYVAARTNVEYAPSALGLLKRLAEAQDDLRSVLEGWRERFERRRPSFSDFTWPSTATRLVESLSAETDLAIVKEAGMLSADHITRRDELRSAFARVAGGDARRDAAAARVAAAQADALADGIAGLLIVVGDEAVAKLATLIDERDATLAVARTSERRFDGEALPGVGGAQWRVMWDAAHAFVLEAAPDRPFPPDHCPLCLQALDDHAARRFESFAEHVRSQAQAAARDAEARLQRALEPLDAARVDALRGGVLDGIRASDADIARLVDDWLDAARSRIDSMRTANASAHVSLAEPPLIDLRGWAESRRGTATTLEAVADPDRERSMRAELDELEGRTRLANRLADVVEWIHHLQSLAAIAAARSSLATGAISRRHRELTSELVTDGLRVALRRELDALDFRHMQIRLREHGKAGETEVSLELEGARGAASLGSILSEGEQRALSLAFFLAELSAAEHDGTIVLDDPVSSLDHERRRHIATRLCEEATRRQVVVFTHDLPFMLELQEQARRGAIAWNAQGVWRIGQVVGRVDPDPPFEALSFKARVGALANQIQNFPKPEELGSFDQAWNAVCDIYRNMRITWERGVEERLLGGVVQRFSREVHTRQLDRVSVTPELVELVERGMTRCSEFVHDQPPSRGHGLPDRAAMTRDLDLLRDLEKRTR